MLRLHHKILFSIVFLVACSSAESIAPSDFAPSVDASVGCPGYVPTLSDISIDNSDVLAVTSNTRSVPGLYMNAIASRQVPFSDSSEYILSGEFRKPADAQNEQMDVNLQLVQNYVEYHAEILWDLNPYSDLYQWIWTRGQDVYAPVKLFKVADDSNWHKFKLVTKYDDSRTIESITVDGHTSTPNLKMGTLPKTYKTAFGILLETTNQYTACLPINTSVGKSEWRNVEIERK